MNNFYTYAFLREDGSPYYIGKGSGCRATKKRYVGAKRPKDKSRIIILKNNLSEEDAFKHEIYMINIYGRKNNHTGILHNFTDGGEGCSGMKHTEEFKRIRSEKYTGKKRQPHTEETKQKLRISRSNQTDPRLGTTHTEETKKRLSELKCKYVYELTSPKGRKYVANSSNLFCKEYPDLELNPVCIRRASTSSNMYKGWYIIRRER